MKTFREYLEGREVNESFFRNAALAGAAALGLAAGPANAQTPDQKALASITKKIDQADTDINDAHNEIKKLIDGAYNGLLMKTDLTDDEKVFMDWMESLIRRNTSVALKILEEKHYTDSNFNNKLDLNDPVVKFVFKIHPEFKKAMQEGGKNWMQSHAPGAAYDINMERERHPLRTGDSPGMRDILRRSINPR
jgi:cellobiose-specific phosphotransferase system component IIA